MKVSSLSVEQCEQSNLNEVFSNVIDCPTATLIYKSEKLESGVTKVTLFSR